MMNVIDIFPQLLKVSLQFGFQVGVIMHITLIRAIVTTEHGVTIRHDSCLIFILTIFYHDVLRILTHLNVLSLSQSFSTDHI